MPDFHIGVVRKTCQRSVGLSALKVGCVTDNPEEAS